MGIVTYLQTLHDSAKNITVTAVPILLTLTPACAQQLLDVAVQSLHTCFVLQLGQRRNVTPPGLQDSGHVFCHDWQVQLREDLQCMYMVLR